MKINFIDLKMQYNLMKEEIDKAILAVVDSTNFIQGNQVKSLEKSLSQYTGAAHTISCANGTDALLLSLMAIDTKPGDEVITTPFTFFATAEVIALLGATPVFIDIDPITYNMDENLIEEKISAKTKAILPVSIFGQCSNMGAINELAVKHNLHVIEDACQSFGADYEGRKSCNLSTIGCTSFFPSKPLGCYGDGGAVFTNDQMLATKLRSLMNHGQRARYDHQYIGINGRLDEIQAAVLNVKLKYFSEEVEARSRIGLRYTQLLNGKVKDIITPTVLPDRTSVYAQYSIRVKNREQIINKLNAMGIPTAVHYPIPLYKQTALKYLGLKEEEFPTTEKVSKEIMSLPMSPYIQEQEQDFIINSIAEVIT